MLIFNPMAAVVTHIPVLLEEVLSYLPEQTPLLMLDCTLGLGGHSERVLATRLDATIVALDQDSEALAIARTRLIAFKERLSFYQLNFGDVAEELAGQKFDFILADLGVSSLQLDSAVRGFSFNAEAALDMRMSQDNPLKAEDVLNAYTVMQLRQMFERGGLQKYPRKLAEAVVNARPLRTTIEFAQVCQAVIPRYSRDGKHSKIHPATIPFQAVRMEVNQELIVLKKFLANILDLLAPAGRLAIISFHSLEDKYVARAMRGWSRVEPLQALAGIEPRGSLLTKKAIVPTPFEIDNNARSRSAKLRVFEARS